MSRRSVLVIVPGLIVAAMVFASTLSAKPIDKGHFHDSSVSPVYDCEGTLAQDSNDVDVSGDFGGDGGDTA